jgi:hypothetical protein
MTRFFITIFLGEIVTKIIFPKNNATHKFNKWVISKSKKKTHVKSIIQFESP